MEIVHRLPPENGDFEKVPAHAASRSGALGRPGNRLFDESEAGLHVFDGIARIGFAFERELAVIVVKSDPAEEP